MHTLLNFYTKGQRCVHLVSKQITFFHNHAVALIYDVSRLLFFIKIYTDNDFSALAYRWNETLDSTAILEAIVVEFVCLLWRCLFAKNEILKRCDTAFLYDRIFPVSYNTVTFY